MKKVEGNIVDVFERRIYPGEILISPDGKISEILPTNKKYDCFILPGFVDAHVHIESSMLIPVEFSKMVIRRGTVAVVNDPHEIANVMGIAGVRFMLENATKAEIKIFFGIPSCVPATPFDSAGSELTSDDILALSAHDQFVALSEMMNVPGVLQKDAEVIRKLEIARNRKLPVDGHAPGLSKYELKAYAEAGISTDHECVSLEEALEKIASGMKIIIREGSAAQNFQNLHSLIQMYPDRLMFCVDDAHPDDILRNGEIDRLVKESIRLGYDLFDVLKIASINAIEHYHLPVGMLRKGDDADFVIVENLESFRILSTYIDGIEKYNLTVFPDLSNQNRLNYEGLNCFQHDLISFTDLQKPVTMEHIPVIQIKENEIVTAKYEYNLPSVPLNNLESDLSQDILKIVYLNRYANRKPQIAFIRGFGLKEGAFATTIAHDSHNLLAVGVTDADLAEVINRVIGLKGGLAVKNQNGIHVLSLPIAGIMTDQPAEHVAERYNFLNEELKRSGCILKSPFMTLAFMSLLVIPELKIGEKGLFDFNKFDFIAD
ncbi:adenine deaminase [uncultured Culturomica sp.]|jgi:adenine deaminase|uniref:adenine deaminase n=1 Tax=uncultured Culturomica sp. TaxID=1926654 RepID=UPI00033E5245|nr:adenine deaminase [uncultured Culturomica sp.]CCZ10118.1 adenine deaminase [Odoribacter sp. CAG:788]